MGDRDPGALADRQAVVAHRRMVVRVRAMRAEPAQTKQVWELASEIYPGYTNYAGGRLTATSGCSCSRPPMMATEIDSAPARVGS